MRPRATVLVTGASGLLGGRIAELLSSRFEVTGSSHHAPCPAGLRSVPLDLLSPASLESALVTVRPDAVVHSAALADADACERDPDLAFRLNVEAAARVARACQRLGLRLVALSTDLVLSGRDAFTTPWARPEPTLVYGGTKAQGESEILREAPEAAVARVCLVVGRGFGPRGTASEAIAWALRAGRPLRLFTDQHRTPVDASSVADATARLVETPVSGIVHLGGSERISRFDLGLRVAAALGLPATTIQAVTSAEYSLFPPRPADVSLDISDTRRQLGWEPASLDEAIRASRPGPA